MTTDTAVSSAPLGRKPSDNPKGTTLGVRVDADTLEWIDAELEDRRRKNPRAIVITRAAIVRAWIDEAIDRRKKRK